MNNIWFYMAIVVFSFLIEIITGITIQRRSKPYPTILFAIHKIIPVAFLIFLILLTANTNKVGELELIVVIILVGTLLVLLGSAVSGGWISAMESYPQVLSPLHRLFAYVTVPLTLAAYYLLLHIFKATI